MIELFKVLGDENRLRIVQLLMKQALCVCEIETLLEMKQSNVSRHLNKLKQSNVIVFSKRGQWVYYQISKSFISEYKNIVEEINRYFKETPVFVGDLLSYTKYINLNLNCEDIKENQNLVNIKIRGTNDEK